MQYDVLIDDPQPDGSDPAGWTGVATLTNPAEMYVSYTRGCCGEPGGINVQPPTPAEPVTTQLWCNPHGRGAWVHITAIDS